MRWAASPSDTLIFSELRPDSAASPLSHGRLGHPWFILAWRWDCQGLPGHLKKRVVWDDNDNNQRLPGRSVAALVNSYAEESVYSLVLGTPDGTNRNTIGANVQWLPLRFCATVGFLAQRGFRSARLAGTVANMLIDRYIFCIYCLYYSLFCHCYC